MNIGLVWYGGYPYARDIDMISQALMGCGANPIIIASACRSSNRAPIFNNVPIYYMPPNIVSCTHIAKVKSYHFPFNMYWKHWITKLADVKSLDALIVHETPLAYVVLAAAKQLGIPAFLDMRENLSESYRMNSVSFIRNPAKYLLRHYKVVQAYEKAIMSNFKHILTVSEGLKEWAVCTYNIQPNRITAVENTPSLPFLKEADLAIEKVQKSTDVITLVYAGFIEERKGLGRMVEALPFIVKKEPRVRLRVIGEGKGLKPIKRRINELNLHSYVEFFPLLDLREYTRSLAECHIGLETCPLNEFTHQTIPGKIFEYMAMGLPVLSSDRRSVRRILMDTGAGRLYSDASPGALAQSVLEIIDNQAVLCEMSNCARVAIMEKYNWERTLNTVKKVFGGAN